MSAAIGGADWNRSEGGHMDVRVTARHCSIPEAVREAAQTRVERLTRFEPRVEAVDIQFSEANALKHVDVRVVVPGASQMLADGEGESFRTALDHALGRLQRQVRRRRVRRLERQGQRTADALSAPR
jgi:ribosomal subunit interface protein